MRKMTIDEILNKDGILVKFVEKKYVDSFCDGEIHFESLSSFIDKEKIEGDTVIGDEYEGARLWNISIKRNFSHQRYVKTTLHLDDEDKRRLGVASFFYIPYKEMDVIDKSEKAARLRLSQSVIEYFRNFNKTAKRIPVVLTASFFYKKMKEYMDDENSRTLAMGPVCYYDENDSNFKDISYLELAFRKRNRYSEQKEYRVVYWLDDNDERYNAENYVYEKIKNLTYSFHNEESLYEGLVKVTC